MKIAGPAEQESELGTAGVGKNHATSNGLRHPETRQEEGQVLVLIIGFVLTALLVATVVIAASSVYLEHKKLLSARGRRLGGRGGQLHPRSAWQRRRHAVRRPQRGAGFAAPSSTILAATALSTASAA